MLQALNRNDLLPANQFVVLAAINDDEEKLDEDELIDTESKS